MIADSRAKTHIRIVLEHSSSADHRSGCNLDEFSDLYIMLNYGTSVDNAVVAESRTTIDYRSRHDHYAVANLNARINSCAGVDHARPALTAGRNPLDHLAPPI
jgi:hypothetical protein